MQLIIPTNVHKFKNKKSLIWFRWGTDHPQTATLQCDSKIKHIFLLPFQDIDGRSLLLMHRNDVVSNLGIKLGPALKLFSCIKKLQTRRNFPDCY